MARLPRFELARRALASPHLFWLLPLVVLALLAPGFDAGWLIDDHVHRAALVGEPDLPELHRAPHALFSFVDGDPRSVRRLVDRGLWPWWAAPALRLDFLRPLAGWTHGLDYRLWPRSPRIMHWHSALWYLAAVTLLLVFYRRWLPGSAVGGLAALLYAIDDSQTLPALWLANRNTLVSLTFGVAALVAHDRWRRDGHPITGTVVAPLLLLAAVLANEGAVAIGGYLLGYALFVDPAPRRERFLALVPSTAVGVVWAAVYRAGNYGASGSGVYVDPLAEPLRFLATVVERAPLLLWGWWGPTPADLTNLMPDATRVYRWLLAVLALVLVAWLLRPVLRRHAVARALALGMILALVPASAVFPSNRLLAFAGIGAAGLLALLFTELLSAARARAGAGRWGRWLAVGVLTAVHVVLPPLTILPYLGQMQRLDMLIQNAAASLSAELVDDAPASAPALADREVIVVATPSAFISLAAEVVHALGEHPRPRRTRVLASSIYDTEVRRTDPWTLEIRPVGGFLRPPGARAPAGVAGAGQPIDTRRTFLLLDSLFRDLERDPFATGDSLRLDGMTLTVLATTDDGRPLAIACRFAEPLDSPRWHWLAWRQGRYVPFPLPAVGETAVWPGLYATAPLPANSRGTV